MDRDQVYKISRASLLKQMKSRQAGIAIAHSGLKNKDSSYANSLAAMRDIYTDIVEVIAATPDT